MEDRSFEPVKIGMLGAETGKSRFYQDREYRAPPFAYWRVNLTALSQKYNLYFFASRNRIQVYRPEFPYQTLGPKPALTILPQLNNSSARGYIDEEWPHNINHLIVGDLGNQEILLLSTDSGNVVAYYTNAINEAAEDNPYRFSVDGNADFVGLRPFFSQWVHESAWGLAIHSEGRMIAVSANTPRHVENNDPCSKVTVFAFALSRPSTGIPNGDRRAAISTSIESSEWVVWSPASSNDSPATPPRDRDYKIILAGSGGHKSNIPSISFLNVPEDRHGSWLLSTDVVGRMKLWQIWKGKCVSNWDFGDQNNMWIPHEDAGWLVAAFDPLSFRPAETNEKLIGFSSARRYNGYHQAGDSFDLSGRVQDHLPQNSKYHPCARLFEDSSDEEEKDILYPNTADSEDEEVLETQSRTRPAVRATSTPDGRQKGHSWTSRWNWGNEQAEVMAEINSDGDASNPIDQAEDSGDDGSTSEEMEIEITGALSDIDEDEEDEITDEEESMNINEDDGEDEHSPDSLRSATTVSSYVEGDEAGSDFEHGDNGNHDSQDTISSSTSMQAKTPTNQDKTGIPLVPILQCSTSHVRLFSSPTAQSPHVFYAKMLKQQLPARMEHTNFSVLDRLNMLHQIPELGIVLIASQLGRCAVCSLTKREEDGLCALRVDWILPTKKQERDGARPAHHVLLGIAASPIQGRTLHNQTSISENDSEEDWARDRVIHGVPTTFDPNVVSLRSALRQASIEGESDEEPDTGQAEIPPNPRVTSSLVPIEKREWRKPREVEEFKTSDNSRPYRLMLTYSDMSVLTYELSREVEKEDKAKDF